MRSPDSADDGGDGAGTATKKARHLLAMALEPSDAFAEYELVRRIGTGATSVVYRARRAGEEPVVALKIMRDAYAATDAELRRFHNGAAAAAALDHPHVVRVLDFGDHQGVPFVAMTLVEGESLREALQRRRPSPAEAAAWMVAIARAVQHAHDGDVLHRDLKPANILIDETGQPHVADFGLAKRLDQQATGSPGQVMGTLAYMAPEQATGEAGPLTFAADIYSLGVIFYEMLTGQVPLRGESVDELLRKLRRVDPIPPRALNPAVGRDFETVCLACLEKNPARRYGSAAALADDLERAARGVPIAARAPSLSIRAVRWARRHPRASAGVAAAAAVVLVTAALALALWRAREREEARVLDTNAFIASGQAGAVLFQLRAYADRVERAAQHPLVRSLLARGEIADHVPGLEALATGFDSVFVETNDGRLLAEGPAPAPHVLGRMFDFRDYFRGARHLAQAGVPGVYVARAFRSESRDLIEFALSAPVMNGNGEQLGMFAVTLSAQAAFGAVRMQEDLAGSGRITTALLGPRGNDRGAGPDGPLPSDLTFLVHPGLGRGAEYTLGAPSLSQLRAVFGPAAPPGEQFALQYVPPFKVSSYRDPIPGFEGPWLAAFAPVGETGFVVLVETRKESAFPFAGAGARGLAVAAVASLALALPFVTVGVLAVRRRRARQRH